MRRNPDGSLSVLLVTSRQTRRWVIPKGWPWPDREDHVAAALREVEEETGLRCRMLDELPETRYTDRHGRPKRVRYWSMQVDEDLGFDAGDEVDERRWLTRDDARGILSYDMDRDVLDALRAGSAS